MTEQAWFLRDASFWPKPDTRTVKKVHLRHPDAVSRYGHNRALCGNVALIEESDHGEFHNPPETMKCKRCLKCLKKT